MNGEYQQVTVGILRRIQEQRLLKKGFQRHGIPQETEDLLRHNCRRFNFRRAEPNGPVIHNGKQFFIKVSGNIECSSGEALAQLTRVGASIVRIGEFSVSEDLQRGDQEPIHTVFVRGSTMPARARLFVNFLLEHHRI